MSVRRGPPCFCAECVAFRVQGDHELRLYYQPGEFEDTADTEPDVDANVCMFCGSREQPGQYGPYCASPNCPVYDPTSGQR